MRFESAAPRTMRRPTAVLPVNETLSTPAMAGQRLAGRRIAEHEVDARRLAGRPRRAGSRQKRSSDSGVNGDGLSTAVLPIASAGAIFQAASSNGKFHGTIKRADAERFAQRVVEEGRRRPGRSRRRACRSSRRSSRRRRRYPACRRRTPRGRACRSRARSASPARRGGARTASPMRCSTRARSRRVNRAPRSGRSAPCRSDGARRHRPAEA